MPSPPGYSIARSAFDDFLFAFIVDEEDGRCLTVVSALARLDLDPWAEAARLSELPKEGAIDELAAIITGHSGERLQLSDPRSIATRLVSVLPKHRPGRTGHKAPKAAEDRAPRSGTGNFWRWLLVAATVIIAVWSLNSD